MGLRHTFDGLGKLIDIIDRHRRPDRLCRRRIDEIIGTTSNRH